MTKREFVWLLIRLAGVYFAYLAVVTLFTVVTSGWGTIFAPPKIDAPSANGNRSVSTVPGIQPAPFDPAFDPTNPNQASKPMTVSTEPEKPEDKLKREALMSVLGQLLLVLIYGGLSFYFLRDGRILYMLLMREESDKLEKSEPEVTTLNL